MPIVHLKWTESRTRWTTQVWTVSPWITLSSILLPWWHIPRTPGRGVVTVTSISQEEEEESLNHDEGRTVHLDYQTETISVVDHRGNHSHNLTDFDCLENLNLNSVLHGWHLWVCRTKECHPWGEWHKVQIPRVKSLQNHMIFVCQFLCLLGYGQLPVVQPKES